uniref:Uncharacterized protein n=1 Tax=Onchocerca volvulus TaxID=6282 RepID=A0A8R1TXG5_ONCVO
MENRSPDNHNLPSNYIKIELIAAFVFELLKKINEMFKSSRCRKRNFLSNSRVEGLNTVSTGSLLGAINFIVMFYDVIFDQISMFVSTSYLPILVGTLLFLLGHEIDLYFPSLSLFSVDLEKSLKKVMNFQTPENSIIFDYFFSKQISITFVIMPLIGLLYGIYFASNVSSSFI